MEKIGLQSVFVDAGFQAGAVKYSSTVAQVSKATDQATESTSKLLPISSRVQAIMDENAAATARLKEEVRALAQRRAELDGGLTQTVGVFESLLGSIGPVALGLAGLSVTVATAALKFGEAGASILRVEEAFDEATYRIGVDADELKASMDKASADLIVDNKMMYQANRMMSSGIKVNTEDMMVVIELARLKAHQYGITTEEAFNKIATGAQRGTARQLMSLGIFIKQADAMDELASSTGNYTGEVDVSQRSQATWNAVVKEGREQLEKFGRVQDDAADKYERMHVATTELKQEWLKLIAVPVSEFAQGLSEELRFVAVMINLLKADSDGFISTGEALRLMLRENREEAEKVVLAYEKWLREQNRAAKGMDELATSAGQAVGPTKELEEGIKAVGFAAAGLGTALVQFEELDKIARKSAQEVIKAEEKAADQRESAREQLTERLTQLEEDHFERVVDINEKMAQVLVDLTESLREAEEEAARDRLELQQDLIDELAESDQKYRESLIEEEESLNRDLEDLERDHLNRLKEMETEYYEALAQLAEEYNERRLSIEEKYAQERQAINDKYAIEEKKSFDDRRKALLDEIRKLQEQQKRFPTPYYPGTEAYTNEQRLQELMAELDALKQEELAALDERKKAELDELAKWLEKEQQVKDEAYLKDQEAERNAYKKRRDDRQAQYNERLADLQVQHEKERAEIERRNIEALAQVDKRLAEEQAKLQAAAVKKTQQLQEQLEEEGRNYAKSYAKLVEANRERLTEIDRALEEEKIDIRTKAQEAAAEYIMGLKGIGPEAKEMLLRQAEEDIQPALDDWVRRFEEMSRRAGEAVRKAMEAKLEMGSASKWAIRVGVNVAEAFGEGIRKAMRQSVNAPSFNLGNYLQGAMIAGGNSSVNNVKNYNLTANFPTGALYPGIQDQFRMMEFTS